MKAIHGGKSKNDQIDAGKIARRLRGGTLPPAYVYPAGMRSVSSVFEQDHKRAVARATARCMDRGPGRALAVQRLRAAVDLEREPTDSLRAKMPAARRQAVCKG